MHGSDRLQCEIGHGKSGLLHCRIQAVNHLFRQKGSQHISADPSCLMTFQIGDLISVHIVFDHGIANTVIPLLGSKLRHDLFMCPLYAQHFQRMNVFQIHDSLIVKLILTYSYCSPQHPSGSSNADFRQIPSDLQFQFRLYRSDLFRHRSNVMNLSVHHCSGLMQLHTLSYYMKPFHILISNCTHNASGSDIQTEHQRLRIFC